MNPSRLTVAGAAPASRTSLSPDSLFVALACEPMHGSECGWRRLALSISAGEARALADQIVITILPKCFAAFMCS